MDVTCTRCGTTYEFEEGLVSTTGTTVKCTQCGHLFKVHRGTDTATLPDPPAELRWRVRRADGSVHTLQSLADLTPLISAGQFRRDDELSRTGQVWRKLGDVAELAPMFEGGRSRLRSDPPPLIPPPPITSERAASERAQRSSDPPPPPPPPTVSSDVTVTARPRRASGFEAMGSPIDLSSPPLSPIVPPPPAPRSNPSERAERAERASVPLPPRPSEPPPRSLTNPLASPPAPPPGPPGSPSSVPPVLTPAPIPTPALPADATFHDALVEPPRPRLWLWVLLVSAVLAGAGAGISRLFVPASTPESPAPSLLARGDAELASHRTTHFDQAITAYMKALAYHPDDPHILSSLSRVYAVWSQALRDQAQPGADDTEGKRLAEQAKLYGERAAQRNPGNEEASVVLSDALRLTSNLVAARAELDRARATEGVPAAETLRVAALLAIDEANGELQAGRSLAEQAVAQDPSLIRARLLLARCLLRAGDYEGAELHLDAVAKIDAAHPLLALARAELEAAKHGTGAKPVPGAAPGTNAALTTDAGTLQAALASAAPRASTAAATGALGHPAGRTAATTTTPDATAKPAAGTAAGKASAAPSGAAAAGESAPEYAKRGEDLLERGSVPAAAHAFERALELDPGMPRAKVGLGYVALERAQPANAVGLFRAAATAGSAEALIGLGDAYRRLGKLRAALSAYREYVQRYPKGDRGSIARHQIELLTEQLSTTGSDSEP